MNFRKLITYLTMGTAAAMPLAVAQNPTILQGNYITNVFGNSNFVLNPNAQTNVANVTVSSATVTRSTTTPLVATSEFNVAITSANGTVTWDTRAFDAGMKGQNCEARFTYRGFASTSKVHIKQGVNTVASLNLTASTDPRIASINFPCGDLSAATTFVVTDTAILSGSPTPNEIGGIYVGLATNMANVAQAELVGTFRMTGVASCLFSTSSLSYGTPSNYSTAVSACNTPTTTGDITSIGKVPGFNINVKPGKYYVVVNAPFYRNNFIAGAFWSLTDGTTRSEDTINYIGTTVDSFTPNTINYVFDYSTSGTKTIYLDAKVDNGSTQAGIQNYSGRAITFYVYRFPSSSELVVKPETQNVFGAASWTGGQIFNRTNTTEITVSDAVFATNRTAFGKAEFTTTANDVAIKVPQMPPGTYRIELVGQLGHYSDTAGNNDNGCAFYLKDGTNTAVAKSSNFGPQYIKDNVSTAATIVRYTSVADRTFTASLAGSYAITQKCYVFEPKIIITPLDQPSNSALYVQGPVLGSQTGAAIPSGYQGYTVESTLTGTTTPTNSNQWYTTESVSLTPGVWSCYADSAFYYSGAGNAPTGFTSFTSGICSGVNCTPASIVSVHGANTTATGNGVDFGAVLNNSRIFNVSATTTYYLSSKFTFTARNALVIDNNSSTLRCTLLN